MEVAIEATSLLGPRTGIGTMTSEVLSGLGRYPEIRATALLVSWRGRSAFAAAVPSGVRARALRWPARAAHWAWARFDRPAVRGYDVVHGPNFVVPPTGGGAALVTVQDLGPWRYPQWVTEQARSFPHLVERAIDRGADVHTSSRFVADEVIDVLGIASDRVHVVGYGFDPSAAGDPVEGRRLAGAERYVVVLGTIEPRKDHPTLVRAMAEVWPSDPDVVLVVVGPDGWGLEPFEAVVAELGVGDRIRRLGYVTDQDRSHLLAGAACLAFPSRYEGFGLPPLEAMAQDTPVVATAVGAVPEVCGDAARLVAPGDPTALAAGLTEVLADDALADRLRAAGRDNLTRFSWTATTDGLVEVYRRLAR